MQNEKAMRVSDNVKIVFFGIALSLIWMRFLIKLIERWNFMKPDIRETIGIFMVLYFFLCLNIARDKRAYLSLSLAGVVLMFVYRIVWMLL